ncbi:hypothetical protein [Gottfriedia solisilvae]|uniref:Uncharacterized protein n=1 Tax=Gottfriedia solisilvae TaxID=1516104 RepID=A0A8J3AEK7_9BACI|nr:hypothetical protein [Gottfriedia solisilvae]GGI12927.1 hypothetical protein GCM10007380_15360 [Gottfriedia solisilvae]
MNIAQLKSKLIAENVDPSAYSLIGGLPNEAYCIGINNGIWEVYYSERGNKSSLNTFNGEQDACLYFYNWLKRMI